MRKVPKGSPEANPDSRYRTKFWLVCLVVGCALTACSPAADQAAPETITDANGEAAPTESASTAENAADHVFLGARVYTSRPDDPWAQAVAVQGDAIVFVGDEAGARAWIGPATKVHQLDGKMVMPGFHDGHSHVMASGGTLNSCDLQDSRSPQRLYELLQECARERNYGPDEWVVGGRWPLAAFENGMPTSKWLDEVFGGRPAIFWDTFGHNVWVSSRALELAGIDALTPNPPQGVIEHDPVTGQPNGTLREDAAELVIQHMPPPTAESLRDDLKLGLAEAARFGITAYVEPGLDAQQAGVYHQADEESWLTARVLGSLSPRSSAAAKFGDEIDALLAQRDSFRGPHFTVDSVKVYVDGVLETRTSVMLQPYLDGSNFEPFYSPQELKELYTRLDAAGLQVHTHAIGDGAIRIALDAYEAALKANGPNDNRHQIVHLQLIDPADIPRFGELNVAADFQGMWCYPDQYIDVAIPVVGEDRVRLFYPVASVQRAGGLLVGGSDWNVSSLNPLDAIETLVRREDPNAPSGPELGTGERIDLETALAMYTRNAAWIMRLENTSGSLEAGKKADLIVLDRNLFDVPATGINEARVEMTMMGGKVVYSAPGW